MSESDVCGRQILMSKDGPRAERVKRKFATHNNLSRVPIKQWCL